MATKKPNILILWGDDSGTWNEVVADFTAAEASMAGEATVADIANAM